MNQGGKQAPSPFSLTQTWWRKVGVGAVALAALMAWVGAEAEFLRRSVLLLLVYWGIFTAVFVTALLMVILDLRYIRLQYVLGKREIFQQTLGDEQFRKSLKQKMDRRGKNGSSNGPE
jgi:hypothetical protein